MRTISDSALAQIMEHEGTDPITLVQIFWDEQESVIYGDRAFLPQIRGQLLDVGEIENVINASEGSNSGSVNIRLNDTDGSLKTIMDGMDIHKRPVFILQWFPPIPLNDAFIVFDGVISSPIVWKEGDRTLSFDVLSKIEDLEVGYSAEEGNFEYIPDNMVGKPWPMVFGNILHLPCLRINDIPSGYSQADSGVDGSTQGTIKNIGDKQRINISELMELERLCFTTAAILLGNARALDFEKTGGTLAHENADFTSGGDFGSASFNRISDDPIAQQLYDLGTQYEAKGNEYLKERMRPMNVGVFDNANNQALAKNQVKIAGGTRFPQKTNVIITIGGIEHEGYFEGDIFNIVHSVAPFTDQQAVVNPTEVIDREVATEFKTDLKVGTFFVAIAGSTVGVALSHYPVYYIAAIPWVSNIVVLGTKNGKLQKFTIPSSYYTIQFKEFGTLKVTIIVMTRPLSSRGQDWDDEVFINCRSPIGPNAVDIIEYLVENYTNQSIDPTTFATVRPLVNTYKCNFAIQDRRNALQVIQDIAYQSRCAIWFKGGRFYLKYLPMQDSPVDTIAEEDIESGTLEVFTTETEDVKTKWSISWRPTVDQEPPYKIVYRYNIKKYGLIAEEYDCYIYNAKASVQKFALFWLIRKSNTWKKIRFSTFMTKLRLEPFDSVLINFTYPWVNDPGCVVPTVGVIERASYDSETQRIQMEIWLPIRFGEMCPYDFAYPSDVPTTFIYPQPNDPNINTDIPGSGSPGQLYDQSTQTGPGGTTNTTATNSGFGGGVSPNDINDTNHSENFNPPTELDPSEIQTSATGVDNVTTVSQRIIKPLDITALDVPDAAFPGIVRDRLEGNKYNVEVFFSTMQAASKVTAVIQLQLDTEDTIPSGTSCVVLRNARRNTQGLLINIEYTMQVPVWIKPKENREEDDDQPPDVPVPDEGTPPQPPEEPPPETDEGDQ